MTRIRTRSVITVAEQVVPITVVCTLLGIVISDGAGRPRKVRCPFGEVYHSDHGHAPAMRVYVQSNSAWCFACGVYYTPVTLAAQAWDCTRRVAATRLLEHIGHRPLSSAVAWVNATRSAQTPQRAQLAQALQTYCRRIEDAWARLQFDPLVAATLSRCLALLELVDDEHDAQQWLAGCKIAMARAVTRAKVSDCHPDAVDSW